MSKISLSVSKADDQFRDIYPVLVTMHSDINTLDRIANSETFQQFDNGDDGSLINLKRQADSALIFSVSSKNFPTVINDLLADKDLDIQLDGSPLSALCVKAKEIEIKPTEIAPSPC